MASPTISPVDVHPVALARASEEAYGLAIRSVRHNAFWWYMHGEAAGGNFWKPFRDGGGRWWWYVKPGFAWPIDFFSPITSEPTSPPRSLLLGWQYPTTQDRANSIVRINVIEDLSGYDIGRVSRKKRDKIRRALARLRFSAGDPADGELADEACVVWNSHVARTGWNRPLLPGAFRVSWAELATCPGTTVLTARDAAKGNQLCAWLIARVIGGTIHIDTITSHTDRTDHRPNDGLIFFALMSAASSGARRANYALQSNIESLEAFKRSLGFVPHPFPCRLRLRRPVASLLRTFRPHIYKRLLGDESWKDAG